MANKDHTDPVRMEKIVQPRGGLEREDAVQRIPRLDRFQFHKLRRQRKRPPSSFSTFSLGALEPTEVP